MPRVLDEPRLAETPRKRQSPRRYFRCSTLSAHCGRTWTRGLCGGGDGHLPHLPALWERRSLNAYFNPGMIRVCACAAQPAKVPRGPTYLATRRPPPPAGVAPALETVQSRRAILSLLAVGGVAKQRVHEALATTPSATEFYADWPYVEVRFTRVRLCGGGFAWPDVPNQVTTIASHGHHAVHLLSRFFWRR